MLYWLDFDTDKKYLYAYKDQSLEGYNRVNCPSCNRIIASERYVENQHHLLLEGGRVYPDYLQFSGAGKRLFLLSEKSLTLFRQHDITGFEEYEQVKVEINKEFKKNINLDVLPRYYSIKISGEIHVDLHAMHLKRKKVCPYCQQFSWSRQRLGPIIVDLNSWDGSDICMLKEFPGFKICSEKVVQIVNSNGLTGFEFCLLE